MIVVADTSVLIYLGKLEILWVLRELYGVVHVPGEVWREAVRASPHELEVEAIEDARAQAWLVVCEVEIHTDLKEAGLDVGELAAISLAIDEHADEVLLDDGLARREAGKFGLNVRGTVGVLVEARRSGLIGRVEPLLDELLTLGFRVAENVRRQALRAVHED